MRFAIIVFLFAISSALAAPKEVYRLIPIEGGGFVIEYATAERLHPKGIAAAMDVVPFLARQPEAEKVDFRNGMKLDGVYTIIVGREDGTLGKFEGASDVIAFAAPDTLVEVNGVTTMDGGVVFALKIDNKRAMRRFERGTITLTQTTKAV